MKYFGNRIFAGYKSDEYGECGLYLKIVEGIVEFVIKTDFLWFPLVDLEEQYPEYRNEIH